MEKEIKDYEMFWFRRKIKLQSIILYFLTGLELVSLISTFILIGFDEWKWALLSMTVAFISCFITRHMWMKRLDELLKIIKESVEEHGN